MRNHYRRKNAGDGCIRVELLHIICTAIMSAGCACVADERASHLDGFSAVCCQRSAGGPRA